MMAATIVYDGVRGGNLFEGMRFHLLQKVPVRNTWKGLIRANGGELVPLEKQASIVIADHARKDTPPGSISWTFIDKSVRNGRLEDIEDHRAGPAERVIREVGSVQPGRRSRAPFTHEDDRILMEWCTRAERQGASLRGNELYIQLENKNPRHTFQSWRDRWIKYLSQRPRSAIPDNSEAVGEEQEEHISPPPATRPTLVRSAARRPEPAPQRTAVRSSEPKPVSRYQPSEKEATPRQPFVAKSKGGANFAKEEIQLLVDEYDAILNLDEDCIIDAWINWALEYPNHTAQEWRNYFNKEIKDKKRPLPKATMSPLPRRNFVVPPTVVSPPIVTKVRSRPKPPTRKSVSPEAREVKDSQGSSGQTLPSLNIENKVVDPCLINEKLFRDDLEFLAENLELEVKWDPVICGKKVPLFRLWQVVMSDEFGGFDHVTGRKRWPEVARRLNFNDYQYVNAAHDLEACYSELLADFETQREEYRGLNPDMTLTESQEEAMIASQLRQTTNQDSLWFDNGEHSTVAPSASDDDEHDDDLDYPQPSPVVKAPSSSSKRSFEAHRTSTSSSFNKRQRVDKGKGRETEIPSTPEDKISNTQSRPSIDSSPLKQVPLEPEDDSEAAKFSVWPEKSSRSKTTPNPRMLEPETQDFHFPPGPEEDEGLIETTASPLRNKIPVRDQSSISNSNATRGSGPSQNESSTQSQTESQQSRELQEYVDRHIALGYAQDVVIEALEATTMELANAAFVMEALTKGGGIPDDIEGVWTTWDDEALDSGEQSAETDEYKRVVLKHGKARIKARRRFCLDLKEIGEGS